MNKEALDLDLAGKKPVGKGTLMYTIVKEYPELIPLLEKVGVVCFR